MKGKIITVALIILIFGYFITESIKDDAVTMDPSGVIMSGDDTLGRDWGAIAAERQRMAEASTANNDQPAIPNYANTYTSLQNLENYNGSLLQNNDPYAKEKIDPNNYISIQAGDGREIITGYEREEETEPIYRFQTRHQKETGKDVVAEPQIKFKD